MSASIPSRGAAAARGIVLFTASAVAFWALRSLSHVKKPKSGSAADKAHEVGRRASVSGFSIGAADKREVTKAVKECIANRQELESIRKKIKVDLHKKVPASTISRESCGKMDTFLARLYKEAETKYGKPPCAYCVVELGSMARRESGPYPDYDNFIIVDHTPSGEKDDKADYEVREYFTRLNQYVADRIVRLGEDTGFRLCIGNLNAPYQEYESRYSSDRELDLRGRPELLDYPHVTDRSNLSDFVDSAPICGSKGFEKLYKDYIDLAFSKKEKLNAIALKNIKQNVDGINRDRNASPITAPKGKLPELMNVKSDIYRFPQATITALALYYGIEEKNTIRRIEILTEKGVFAAPFAEKLIKAVEQLIRLRLQVQTSYGEEFEFVSTSQYQDFKKTDEERQAKLVKIEEEIRKEESQLGMSLKDAIKDLNTRIKKLDARIAQGGSVEDLIRERELRNKEFIRLEEMNGRRDYCKDLLKIGKHQYSKETGSTHPDAFNESDIILLEREVLPVLKELFFMAEKSIEGGVLNPDPFKRAY
jgi:hypothetical protein